MSSGLGGTFDLLGTDKRPLIHALTTIVASAMFATFILAFLGFFLDAACSVMLGLIFLRASRGVPRPEFV